MLPQLKIHMQQSTFQRRRSEGPSQGSSDRPGQTCPSQTSSVLAPLALPPSSPCPTQSKVTNGLGSTVSLPLGSGLPPQAERRQAGLPPPPEGRAECHSRKHSPPLFKLLPQPPGKQWLTLWGCLFLLQGKPGTFAVTEQVPRLQRCSLLLSCPFFLSFPLTPPPHKSM